MVSQLRQSSFCPEVLLLLELASAEHCWQSSAVCTTFTPSVFLCHSWNKLLVTELASKHLGLLICGTSWREFLYFCSDGNWPSVWCFTYDFSDLLSGVSCMIKIVCNENEVSSITYCHGRIVLSKIITEKNPLLPPWSKEKLKPGGGL